ncbi:MAG: hypothetical protein VXW65_08350 [Pseudomonadota bacterium]|nr:hypothetical protein [Pseudomonadota bacterium]
MSVQHTQLQQLAERLKCPPVSLNAFSELSEAQLGWLNTQIDRLIQQDQQRLQRQLDQRMPWFARLFSRQTSSH